MDYTKLAKEAYKMYAALRDEMFDAQQAYGIVKVCVRDYPIFREMVDKEEETPEENQKDVIGYIHFIAGGKIPIYSTSWDSSTNSMILCTPQGNYRTSDEMVQDVSHIRPYVRSVYYAHDGLNWYRLYTIDHIEFIEREK